MATLNRWIAYGLLAFALALVFIGAFFGFFGGINDGVRVGLNCCSSRPHCGCSVGGSYSFRMAAGAHAAFSPQRCEQLLGIVITGISMMVAMYAMARHRALPIALDD